MAVTVIQNSCVAGAMFGLLARRYKGSFTATDYLSIATTARAIADEFITENTASGAAIADADNAQVGSLVMEVTAAAIVDSGATSTTAADYINYGKQIYAAVKEGLTVLI